MIYLTELSFSITRFFNNILENIYLNYYLHSYNETIDVINFKLISSFNNLPTWNEKDLILYYKYTIFYINIFLYFLFISSYKLIIYSIRKIY